ncbi:bcl-2-like protein 1 [Aulostomus maculatus]
MQYSNRELVEFFISYKLSLKNYPVCHWRPQDTSKSPERNKTSAATSNGMWAKSRNGTGQLEMMMASPGGIEAVKVALMDSSERFEQLFSQAYSDLSSQIDITPDTAYQSFKTVIDEVFKDGVNWGRIVGLFTFGGVICVKCVEKDMSELVSRIIDWMTMYLDENLSPWIQSQGGWDCFVEMFGRDVVEAAAARRESQETLKKCLLVGVALLGMLVGMLFIKKR